MPTVVSIFTLTSRKNSILGLSESNKDEFLDIFIFTVKRQWLEHLWDDENQFETGIVRANEGS